MVGFSNGWGEDTEFHNYVPLLSFLIRCSTRKLAFFSVLAVTTCSMNNALFVLQASLEPRPLFNPPRGQEGLDTRLTAIENSCGGGGYDKATASENSCGGGLGTRLRQSYCKREQLLGTRLQQSYCKREQLWWRTGNEAMTKLLQAIESWTGAWERG